MLKTKGTNSPTSAGWLKFILFLIPALLYLPGILGKIPYPSETANYTDLMLTHYPNALYLKTSISEFHQIPLWSTFIHSGAPFAANPLSGLFYFPGWLALLFPLPAGISIVLALHSIFATWGMYLFLKTEDIREIWAITGGLILGLLPKLAAHYGAGHVSLLYAISWTPWLFLISRKDRGGWKTGICAGSLFLADPRWAVYAGVFWITFDIAHRHNDDLGSFIFYYIKAGLTAFLIATPLILPLSEYVGLSTRSSLGVEDIQAFSMSPEKILGLIIPTAGSNPELYLYFGGIVLGLFIFQLLVSPLRRANRFWNSWVLISLLLSFGPWFLEPQWLVNIPIISLLRVPARALFLIGFSFAVVAARTLEYLTSDEVDTKLTAKFAFGIAIAAVGLGLPINIFLGKFLVPATWGFAFILMLAVILKILKPNASTSKWAWIIIGLIVVDLFGAGAQSFNLRDKEAFDNEIMATILSDPSKFRTYSPSYSVNQHIAVENHFEMADGVDPMHLIGYFEFMKDASGVEYEGYSVTIPGFKSGNPAIDNSDAVPDPFKLSLLNVKYVLSGFEIDNPGLIELISKEQLFLYQNIYSSERAWVETSPRKEGDYTDIDGNKISNWDYSPNRIMFSARGPGRLVLSEILYPGWTAEIDGESQPIEPAYGLLRSVNLAGGDHEINIYFRPLTVYAGIGMALVGWVAAIWQINRREDD